jgi:hypothetical protein
VSEDLYQQYFRKIIEKTKESEERQRESFNSQRR